MNAPLALHSSCVNGLGRIRRPPAFSRPAPSRCHRATTSASAPGSEPSHGDPFVEAALRLQNLLRGIGSGEDELMDKMVASEEPETKLQTSAAIGGMVTVAAVVISTLCGRDPWGGASASLDSLSWAAVGALSGLPLIGLRLWSWSPAASKSWPALDDMHQAQLQIATPWFQKMNRGHVAMMMALEVLPLSLLLFPAAQGVIAASGGLYSQLLADPLVMDDPEVLAEVAGQAHQLGVRLAGLVLTAGIAASARGMELSMSEDEYQVVQTAVDNSDRFYRLMSMDVRSRGADAERASLAFKSVAHVYLETRSDASLMAGAISFLDVMYLGGLWYLSGNLAAPIVAALAANWVDYYHLHQAVCQKEAKGSGGTQV